LSIGVGFADGLVNKSLVLQEFASCCHKDTEGGVHQKEDRKF
jgi:hypothetical protein